MIDKIKRDLNFINWYVNSALQTGLGINSNKQNNPKPDILIKNKEEHNEKDD